MVKIKGIGNKKADVPRICGTCTNWLHDNETNRQHYGDLEYPACGYWKMHTTRDYTCENHQFPDYLLQNPDKWE